MFFTIFGLIIVVLFVLLMIFIGGIFLWLSYMTYEPIGYAVSALPFAIAASATYLIVKFFPFSIETTVKLVGG